jgi:hypothetical protein
MSKESKGQLLVNKMSGRLIVKAVRNHCIFIIFKSQNDLRSKPSYVGWVYSLRNSTERVGGVFKIIGVLEG